MRASFSRTLRTLALPILLTAPVFTPGPSCSGGSSSSSGCSRSGDNVVDVWEPSVVRDLTATATSPTSIGLDWSPSTDNYAGVYGYEVRRDPPGRGLAGTDRTSFVDAGLRPETTYCYEVRAVDAQGNRSLWGKKVCATTPSAAALHVQATSLGIDPAGLLRLAYAVGPEDHASSRGPRKLGVSTAMDTLPRSDDPLVIHPDEAWVFLPHPTTGSVLRLAVPELDGRWVAAWRRDDVREGHHAAVIWAEDVLHVAYYEAEAGDLVYVRWKATAGFTAAMTVDADGDVGRHPSIALGADGAVHIVYQAATPGVLRHAWGCAGSLETERVPLADAVDPDADLAVGPDGSVHVCAYDPWAGALVHAVKRAGTWKTAVFDEAGDVGRHPSVAVDPDGVVHVLYADDTIGALRYATNAWGSWTTCPWREVIATSLVHARPKEEGDTR